MQAYCYSECKWSDAGDGLILEFVNDDGQPLGRVSLMDAEAKLWKFEVMLPDRFQSNNADAQGPVLTQMAAKKVVELILVNTIVSR